MGSAEKVAVITGGGRGLGSAFATALAEDGAGIVILDVDEPAALDTAKALEDRGFTAWGVRCDITDDQSVDRVVGETVERLGRIDILVNNAALHRARYNQPFASLTRDEIRSLFEVNVMGIINCSLACRPAMADGGGGVMVNIASTSANASRTPYGVSKLTVRGLTVAFAGEFAADGIRVNAISPGFVGSAGTLAQCSREQLTAILAALGSHLPARVLDRCSDDDLVDIIRSLQLVEREGTVDDVVEALVYLCSDSAGFVTGETLRVAGGSSLGF